MSPPQDPITGRFPCSYPACTKDFKRSSDRFRHIASTHQRGSTTQTTILCPIAGCRRSRGRGLSRPDKLTEHLRKIHNIVRSKQPQGRRVAGNNNDNARYAQGPGEASMTGNVAAVVPGVDFDASSNIYNGQVQGGTNAEYSYGMNTAAITGNLASASAVDNLSIYSMDHLQGGVEFGIFGYSNAFDVTNFDFGHPQGVSNVGMAGATNFIGNVDVGDVANLNMEQLQDVSDIGMAGTTNFIGNVNLGQLPSEVNAGLNASLADRECADAFAAGMPYLPADWIADLSNEMI
jgi:hypothetical protein